MALLNSRKVVVAAKYGATAIGTDTIAISNEDVRLSPDVATGSFKCINGKLGNKTTWKNTDDVSVNGANVEGYLTGNDASGLDLDALPDWDDLYQICGLAKVVVNGVSVTYKPSQTQPSDLSTVTVWRDGFKRSLTGVLGTLSISGAVGEPIKQTVALSGFTTIGSTGEANPTATCINDELLLVLKSTDTMTFSGTSYRGQNFTLTQGNDIQKLYFIDTKDFERVDFDSMLEITYLKENENIYTDFADGTEHNVVIQAGSVDGKAAKVVCGQAIVETITETSINQKEAVTVKFNLKGDATGENQFNLVFGTM
jgi:hypothetical protein